MGLTKFVLKRPVTTILSVICLIVFGLSSVLSSKLELIPEMDMPMLIVATTYVGASPEDVSELVTKPIEDEIGTLNGVKSVNSYSQENISMIILEYQYGTDIDEAYDDLKKKMDLMGSTLPEDADDPAIVEMNINDMATMTLAVNDDTAENLYNYVDESIAPEFEKISSVASVDVSGGQEQYIKVELIPEKLDQYHLSMSQVAQAVGSADFSLPAGSAIVGSQKLSVSAGVSYDTMESLKTIPITVGSGDIIHLEDIANVHTNLEDPIGIGRYNGRDTMTLAIKKQQESSAGEVSKAVNKTIERLERSNPNLDIVVVDDSSDSINASLKSVMETMVMAVIISMIILWLFFGDIKASLIVGTSIPISILAALILMRAMGFSLNVITLGSLVLGVGMMVDNSINVLESCFRAKEKLGNSNRLQRRSPGGNKNYDCLYPGRYGDHLRCIPSSGSDSGSVRTDVQAPWIYDCILYDRLLCFRYLYRAAVLRNVPSGREGEGSAVRRGKGNAGSVPRTDSVPASKEENRYVHQRASVNFLFLPGRPH
jgi:multidrug efflux pump subunit AcrB